MYFNIFSQLIGLYISQLLKKNLLSKTKVFQAQLKFIYLNSAITTVEESAKYVQSSQQKHQPSFWCPC